jgi:hypothetical protein
VLELVEAVPPTIAVKLAACLGLEPSLSEGDLCRSAEVPKRQTNQVLDVVGIRILIGERVGEVGGGINFAELTGQIEGVTVRWLHLDPVGLSNARDEIQARNREALGSEPLCQLTRLTQGCEHDPGCRGEPALHLEGKLGGFLHTRTLPGEIRLRSRRHDHLQKPAVRAVEDDASGSAVIPEP